MNSRSISLLKSLCMRNSFIQNAKQSNTLLRYRPAVEKIQVRGCVNEKNIETKEISGKFIMVYRLKEISLIAAINSSKKLQYLITLIAAPSSAIMGYTDVIGVDTALTIGLSTFLFSVLMTGFSKFLANSIGMLYVSEDLQTIKVSMVDFWGTRKDIVFPADDWVYLSDIPRGFVSNYYLNTKRYSTTDTLKLFNNLAIYEFDITLTQPLPTVAQRLEHGKDAKNLRKILFMVVYDLRWNNTESYGCTKMLSHLNPD